MRCYCYSTHTDVLPARVVAVVEQRNAAELAELEALPEHREEEEGDIELLSSEEASGDSSLPLVVLAPQPTQSKDNINASNINASPERAGINTESKIQIL